MKIIESPVPGVHIFESLEEIAKGAAQRIALIAEECIKTQGRFNFVLSGGKTPRRLYELLASEKFKDRIKWNKTHIFFGDERCVPPEDEESNYRMAQEALLSHVPIKPENVHRMPGELAPAKGALNYALTIEQAMEGEFPIFDCVLLGMGLDGHIASIFPQTEALEETDAWVTCTESPKEPKDRITMTLPLINAANNIIFLLAGEDKAEVLTKVYRYQNSTLAERQNQVVSAFDLPASFVIPSEGQVYWFVDRSAARELVQTHKDEQ